MDANKIETMKALALAATPGPWRVGTWSGYCGKPSHSGGRHPGPRGDDPCVYMPVFFDGGGGIGGPATDIVRCTYDGIQISETDAAHIAASNPAAVLELIAEVERLRAELTAGAAKGGNTSESAGLLGHAKTAETRMNSGFEGGYLGSAPAAGTAEKDAARYRWMRTHRVIEQDDRATPWVVRLDPASRIPTMIRCAEGDLDRTIDAAMAHTKGKDAA